MHAANALVAIGEIELMSITVLPADGPAAMPSRSNSAASASAVSGTMVITISHRSASSRPVAQALAPASSSSGGTPEWLFSTLCWLAQVSP